MIGNKYYTEFMNENDLKYDAHVASRLLCKYGSQLHYNGVNE